MQFSHQEKMAIIKMAYSVILADGKVHPREVAAIHKLKFQIGFDTDFISHAQNMVNESALVILFKMTFDKKKILAEILDQIAISDGHLHEKEVNLIIDTFKNIEMGEEMD